MGAETIVLGLIAILAGVSAVLAFKAYDTAIDIGILVSLMGCKILGEEVADGNQVCEEDR